MRGFFSRQSGPGGRRNLALSVLLSSFLSAPVPGASSVQPYHDPEQLIFADIALATKKPLALRKSPAIVSVVTEEEIQKSGARDLIDVLRLVPGFDFGVDVWGVVGAGFRGNWAHEGKVSLQVDGLELNELLYSNLSFGNEFPVDQIERIEIIRGPGSALHGGFAELAVINVITKGGRGLDGGLATATYGRMRKTYGRRGLGLAYGRDRGDAAFSAAVSAGQGNRSDRDFTDQNGAAYDMSDHSRLDPRYANLSLRVKGLEVRAMTHQHDLTQRDDYGVIIPQTADNDWHSYFLDVRYGIPVAGGLKLTPRAQYKRQAPWARSQSFPSFSSYSLDKTAERFSGGLDLDYEATEAVSLIAGVEGYEDRARDNMAGSNSFRGRDRVIYSDIAGYAQGIAATSLVDVTAGVRYEKHSASGDSLVPRLGLVRQLGRFHVKLLASRAFRAPAIENLNLNPDLRPEKADAGEVEVGYEAGRRLFVSANFFDIRVERPIVYHVDPATFAETYLNFSRTRTRGAEIEARLRGRRGYLTAGYSHYRTVRNGASNYAVPGHDGVVLGLPAHKATLNASCNLTRSLSVNPSLVVVGGRYGYSSLDPAGNPQHKKYRPKHLLNIFVLKKEAFAPGLDLGAGVYDVLDSGYEFLQPYDGGHPPLPGPSREAVVKVGYRF